MFDLCLLLPLQTFSKFVSSSLLIEDGEKNLLFYRPAGGRTFANICNCAFIPIRQGKRREGSLKKKTKLFDIFPQVENWGERKVGQFLLFMSVPEIKISGNPGRQRRMKTNWWRKQQVEQFFFLSIFPLLAVSKRKQDEHSVEIS